MIRTASQHKGVFCLEGNWSLDLRDRSTVRPVLDLLQLRLKVPFVHREYATREELEHYLRKWTQKQYASYPILYLAGHGTEDGIWLDKGEYSLNEMAEALGPRCDNRMILLGSCSGPQLDRRHIQRFLTKNNPLARCGYRANVDWLESTAFELLALSEMQNNEFSGRGVEAIRRKLNLRRKSFPTLKFAMATRTGTSHRG